MDYNVEKAARDCKVGQNAPGSEVIKCLEKFRSDNPECEVAQAFNHFLTIETDPQILNFIIKQFAKYNNEDTFALLIDFLVLKSNNLQARIAVTKIIPKLQDRNALSALLYCLNNKDEDYKLRLACAEALGKLGDGYAVAPLINVVSDEDERSVYLRESAAFALGMLGDNRAVDPLVSILEAKKGFIDKFTYLKERVIEALGRLDSSNNRVFNALKNSLSDEAPHIRISTIEALMNLNDDRAIPLIKSMLHDKDEEVAKNAVAALYNLLGVSILREIIYGSEFSAVVKKEAVELLEQEAADG